MWSACCTQLSTVRVAVLASLYTRSSRCSRMCTTALIRRVRKASQKKSRSCFVFFFFFFSHCWCSQQFLTSNSWWSNPVCDSITADRDRRVHLFSRVSVYTVEIMAIYWATIIQLWEISCKSMRERSTYIPLHFCVFLKRDLNFPPIGSRTTMRLS